MIALTDAIDDYLRVRRALGFQLAREGRLLPDFAAFVAQQGGTYLTAALALRWVMQPTGASPRWWATRLGAVRGLAQYVRALDPRTEIPASARESLPPLGARRREPYIYTAADVRALMRAAAELRGLQAATYATLLGLLAATGLRVGEAIALDQSDLDLREAILVVRSGKFGKSRALPLHPTTVTALRAYARTRDRTGPRPRGPAFFVSLHGTRLLYNNIHSVFLRLVAQAGLVARKPRRPRIHDLRHSFAVQTLVAWYRAGEPVEARLPALSTYLGHVRPSCTYWYLTATPSLLGLAARRLERGRGVRP